jgi:hypothetical protein
MVAAAAPAACSVGVRLPETCNQLWHSSLLLCTPGTHTMLCWPHLSGPGPLPEGTVQVGLPQVAVRVGAVHGPGLGRYLHPGVEHLGGLGGRGACTQPSTYTQVHILLLLCSPVNRREPTLWITIMAQPVQVH